MKTKIVHPAKYSNELLPSLAKHAFGHVVDIMGGTGKAGLLKKLNPRITRVTINELEPEWAEQAEENFVDEIIVGDAAKLKIRCDCIVTSPPYGNRLADNFKSSKPRPKTMAYALDLKRDPTEGSVCCKHFGRGYEELITEIYDAVLKNCEFKRFILNVSNFIRNWKEVDVIGWYKNYFRERGFSLIEEELVATRRHKGVGENTELRVAHEVVMVFEQTPNLTGRKTGEDKTEKQNKGETQMSIESALERIATALEVIAGRDQHGPLPSHSDLAIPAMQAAAEEAPAPKKQKAKKAEPVAKDPTLDDVGAALRAFVTAKGKDAAVKVLKGFNASRLSELKQEDFPSVLEALKV